jgi:hypothetical protein
MEADPAYDCLSDGVGSGWRLLFFLVKFVDLDDLNLNSPEKKRGVDLLVIIAKVIKQSVENRIWISFLVLQRRAGVAFDCFGPIEGRFRPR